MSDFWNTKRFQKWPVRLVKLLILEQKISAEVNQEMGELRTTVLQIK